MYVSSTSTTDTSELHKEADAIIKEGVARFGEVPNPDSINKQLFEQEPNPDLKFLEYHFSPDPLNMQTFIHEHQPQQQQQPETNQPQPKNQDHMDIDNPNPDQPDIEPENPQPPQPLNLDDLVMSSSIVNQVLEKMTH
ncbi:hypothetical protein A2U01_0005592, partial [Trifolium medium]|nr:hypothetical protein [Trifolium medium]